ncbi:MAG: hypothetical protein ACK5LC_05935 [Coprobacillaceae bacterium]
MESIIKLREKSSSFTKQEMHSILTNSKLVTSLTSEFPDSRLYAIWRIAALSEIPYAIELDYTKRLITYINDTIATTDGFSYTGKIDDIVPCYNAMVLEAYCKLGLYNTKEVQNAITWIKQYQLFDRNLKTSWTKKGITKHGGCLNEVPCYIGIGKTVKALLWYNKYVDNDDIKELINKGIVYMKKHKFFKRIHSDKFIYKHITDISFPPSYMFNVVELAEITYLANIPYDDKKDLIDYINSMKKDNGWKNTYVYTGKGYIAFDGKKKEATFTSYILNKYISE